MGMHDCRFLVVFDINEDLKFAKICIFRGEEYHSYWNVHVFIIFGQICVELLAISQRCFQLIFFAV